jgi:hypothetical protein
MVIPVIIGTIRIATEGLRKKFGSHTRKTFSRDTTKYSYKRNTTHDTESIAV